MNITPPALIAGLFALALDPACRAVAATPVPMSDLSQPSMGAAMDMDDSAGLGKVIIDQFEAQGGGGTPRVAWDSQAWYGTDYDKLWLKTEGVSQTRDQDSSRNELLWDHVIGRWWNLQTGMRYDLGHGPARGWAAVGVEGLAPYWFEVEATLYVGDAGRTAARTKVEHDLLITQRLILQAEAELEFCGKSDAARDTSSGLSSAQLGLRIRYEIRRNAAPYVGVTWAHDRGVSAQANTVLWVAGLHAWF